MKKNKNLFRRFPFFVLIFSVYPSLALLSTNIREVDPGVVVRPFLFSLLGGGLLFLLLWAWFKDWTKASLAGTVVLALFFSYGHITRLLVDRFDPAHNRLVQGFMYLAFLALAVLAIRWIAQKNRDFTSWTVPANVIAIVLILMPVIQVTGVLVGASQGEGQSPITSTPVPDSTDSAASTPLVNPLPNSGDPNRYPDVYLIVLDGYSRADTLEALGYDNSGFLKQLEDMGFYVAACSHSTYRHTLLSMSSTFSMDYLWKVIPNSGVGDRNAAPLYQALIHNPVRDMFKQKGYNIVGFETGYQWDQWADADYYLTTDFSANNDLPRSTINPFEYIFLRNSAVYPFIENSVLAAQRFYSHYIQVNYTLDELPKVPRSIPGPKFVYAHIMIPHTPYIFLPDGSLNTDSRFYNTETGAPSNPTLEAEGYLNNVKFLNSRVPEVLDEIIKNSRIPPVIILQGDHGYVIPERRFNNLMAFHLPNGGNDSLYPSISPVNTFRLISNLYFGTQLRLRRDVQLNADVGRPYAKEEVKFFPETCP